VQAIFELDMKELDNDFLDFLKKQFKNAKLKVIVKEDETQYLMKNKANREFLLNSIREIENNEIVTLKENK
jgi:23S rRNA G2445 N2-methylase RlmL